MPTRAPQVDSIPTKPVVGETSPYLGADQLTPESGSFSQSSAPTMPRMFSQLFGRYELQEEIAHGGMGIVYKALDTQLGRVIALKTIHSGSLARPDEIQRFLREAQAVAKLKHAHIIEIHDIGQVGGVHYFTMPYIAGGSLTQQLPRLAAEPAQAVILLEKIARAVQLTHEKGILHRDLKPANVLIDDQGEPVVTDFGLAKFLNSNVELTQSGQVLGTPSYMAPEQAAGRTDQIGPATDVWSLGVILYEILLGRRPFLGQNREEINRQILQSEPPVPRTIQSGFDLVLQAILLKCLQKDTEQRYASAAALANDLANWRAGRPTQARPAEISHRFWRDPRVSFSILAAAVLLLFAGLGWLLLTSKEPTLRDVQDQLAQGRRVTLISETGLAPAWARWVIGGEFAKPLEAEKTAVTLQTPNYALWELLPNPDCSGFVFQGQVRHDDGSDDSLIGLYFGRQQITTPAGQEHFFIEYVFADMGILANSYVDPKSGKKGGLAELGLMQFLEMPKAQVPQNRIAAGVKFHFAPRPPGNPMNEWRLLTIKVTSEYVEIGWDQSPPRRIAQKEIAWRTKFLLAKKPGLSAGVLSPTIAGGLGLIIYRGTASFRNVTIEPLPARR